MRMEWTWRRPAVDALDEMRLRAIAETSAYLTECLRHPELAVRIPMIETGKGRFPPSMTDSFWNPILFD